MNHKMSVPEVPIVPTSSTGEGNISPPPSTGKKKQISPSLRWVFTLNNWTEEEAKYVSAISSKYCRYAICGKEIGESGTPHLQGYVEFKTKKRPVSVFKDCTRIWWKKAKGTREHNNGYCTKETFFFEVGGPKPLKKLACEDNFFDWQKEVLKIIDEEPDDRSIYWFRGNEGGEGKTTFCKYLVRFHKAWISGGKCADMKNGIIEFQKESGCLPELIVLNIPRSFNSDYLSYTGIEEVKDMLFYSGKYEGGMVDGNPPHLIIFSNRYPDVDKCSKDRWKIMDINENKWIHVNDVDHD